ncbi:MAG: hypothetical protein EBT47_12670, partial [Chloroflexi bacterium]|nr:hypothetical protein [Chloroflexota bacterium]
VELQPAGFTLAVQNFLPGSVQVSRGSLLNQGNVPVNLFMTVVAEMSSPLDSDAIGGIHVAIFRCRNGALAPVPCDEATQLVPVSTYMGSGVSTPIQTNAPGGAGSRAPSAIGHSVTGAVTSVVSDRLASRLRPRFSRTDRTVFRCPRSCYLKLRELAEPAISSTSRSTPFSPGRPRR